MTDQTVYTSDQHPCEAPSCDVPVYYDDEPFCYKHSPDGGSFVPGYSYKATHQ